MTKDIWVFIEQNQGNIANVSLELLNEAVCLQKKMSDPGKIAAVVIGHDVEQLGKTCMEYGAEKVYTADDERLKLYQPEYYASVLVKLIKSHDPHILLFGATYTGSQLAPMVAVRVKTGVAAHSIELKIDGNDNMIAVVPAFGGKVLGDILIPQHRPQMASIKPGILNKAEERHTDGEVETVNLDFLKDLEITLQPLRICKEEIKGIPLEEAEIVVCGGFGVGDKEHWNMLQQLAEKLGGSVGCTRPAVDEGWADGEHLMIGTSGKSIRPKVYIGFGISGATHHICGMKDSGMIININRDESADVFKVSDVGLVGDAKEILPLLIESIGK
ncbi:MAG: hypothetical protein APF77_12820 [Clostridia bacterium BRH_c25]|nr:MAG: hypothetical protein APF77_12820 [Clostridia bacterium BRH_c25]